MGLAESSVFVLGREPAGGRHVLTAHAHGCALCQKTTECDDAACVLDAFGLGPCWRRCPTCDAGIAVVDEAPLRPHWVALVSIVLTVRRATRRAVEAARDGSDAFSQFCADVDVLGPADLEDGSPDAWARLGAVQGARDGWLNRPAKVAPDVPSHDGVRECYSAGWCLASMIVGTTKMEMMKHG
jgi:hypothetical protein